MRLMLLTPHKSCESSTKMQKAPRSSSIWCKQHNPNQTEWISQSRKSTSTLWPSRSSSHRKNSIQIPASGKTPGIRTNLDIVEEEVSCGICCKTTWWKSTRCRWSTFWWSGWIYSHGKHSPNKIEWNDVLPGRIPWKYFVGGHQKCFSTGWSIRKTCSKHGYPGRHKIRTGQVIRKPPTRSQHPLKKKEYMRCNGQLKKPRGTPQLRSGGTFSPA